MTWIEFYLYKKPPGLCVFVPWEHLWAAEGTEQPRFQGEVHVRLFGALGPVQAAGAASNTGRDICHLEEQRFKGLTLLLLIFELMEHFPRFCLNLVLKTALKAMVSWFRLVVFP